MKHPWIHWIDRCSRAGGYLSAVWLILIVILIATEIVLRTFFKFSTMIADEFSAYFFVVVVMFGLAETLKEGAHIRVTLLLSCLGPRLEKVVEGAATLIAMVLCSFAFWHSAQMALDAYRLGMTADSISATPVFIPQLMVPIGLLLLNLQLTAHFVRRLLSYPTP